MRCNPIDFSKSTETCFNIKNEEQIVDEPYELNLTKKHGRIHGFFINNTFFIVWFDPDHNLF